MKTFDLTIATPEKNLYHGKATSLVAPSALGYLGVWADHAPLIAALVPGNITIRDAAGNTTVFVTHGKGFIEVLRNKVTLLMDSPVKNE